MNLRNLVIWGVIIVVLIGLYSMMTGGGRGAGGTHEITYSQLLSKVDQGDIKTASWGNQKCLNANLLKWRRYGFHRSLANEPNFPVMVWPIARKQP